MTFSAKRRTVLAGLVGMAATLPLAGCGGSDDSPSGGGPEKSSVTVGALPVVDFAGLWLAQQKGLFKEQGLNVKIQVLPGGSAAVAKLVAGSLDFSINNYVSAIQATESGTAPMKILLDAYQLNPDASGVLVPADSSIKKPDDLKGKKIAVNTKSNVGQLLVTAGLQTYNVKPSDSQFVEVDHPQMASALKSKSVDAAWTVEPFVTQIQKELGGRLVLDTAKGATADFPISAYTTTEKFAEDNPNTTAAFKKALIKASQMIADDRGLVKKTLPTYAHIDSKTASLIHIANYPGAVNQERSQQVADLMTQYGFLAKHFDIKPML